jgi:hypothetical protein
MRNLVIGFAAILGLGLCAVLVFGQGEARRDPPAPTDKALSWTMAEMTAVGRDLAATKGTTHRFFG